MRLEQNLRENETLRESFFTLARQVFQLDFAPWYHGGYWGDSYRPYAMVEGDRVVANASVNLIHTLVAGVPRLYIQLGTVMTHPDYRGQGLSRQLLEEILREWADPADSIYLYANSTVEAFYPRFGFVRATEHQYSCILTPKPAPLRRLCMDKPEDRSVLLECYRRGNPYSALPMLENPGLLMFYCGGPLAECVYLLPEQEVVAILLQEGDTTLCYDLFCKGDTPFLELLAAVALPSTQSVTLGFTPRDTTGCRWAPCLLDDCTLFVLEGKENPFTAPVMLPLLSHA